MLFAYWRSYMIQVSLGADRWFDQDTRVSMALEAVHEKVPCCLNDVQISLKMLYLVDSIE